MLITKIFTAESMHRVVNCSSEYCKYSCHGHSAKIELTLQCQSPDNGGMGYDFGLLKGAVKDFIESMDHAALLYKYDDPKYVEFIKEFNKRWVVLPVSPSAEFLSAFIFKFVKKILEKTVTSNGEGVIQVYSVKYHETSTGSATCFSDDLSVWFPDNYVEVVEFSNDVMKEWSDDLRSVIDNLDSPDNLYLIHNPMVDQQVKRNW